MNKRSIVPALIGILMSVIIILCLNIKDGEKNPEYILFYAENQTADYPTTLGGLRFAELVEERTEGRIRIIVKYDGELGREKDVIDQMRYGGIAFSRVSLSQLAEYIPRMNVLQMPYLYTDSNHMWRVLEGDIGSFFLDMVKDVDLVGLSWYDAGARNFYSTNKPITCLEDLRGMTIRVQESDMMSDMVEALGATAVKLPYSEVYSSLEQGRVDGAENNLPSYETMKHYEVARYYTIDEHTRVPEMQICSEIIWNKLSEKDRQIILECARESAIYEKSLWKEREEEAGKIIKEFGISVITLDSSEKQRFQNAMNDVYQKYSGDMIDVINKIIDEGNKR